MYRINLYPERTVLRRNERRRIGRAALLGTLAGVEIVIIGWLIVSAFLLQDRIADIEEEIPRLVAQGQTEAEQSPDLRVAQAMLRVRLARVDWAPKLAAMGEAIGPSLELTRIAGQAGGQASVVRLTIAGRVLAGGSPLDEVAGYLAALKADARIAVDFQDINVGNLGGREADRFEITCARDKGGEQ